MKSDKKIALTVGDPQGIGPETAKKALLELDLPQGSVVTIGTDLNLKYEHIEIPKTLSVGEFCYSSLVAAANLVKAGSAGAIVTGPVSKKALADAGYNFSGQTEVLESLLARRGDKAEMLFVARDLRLLLLTRHLPLKDVVLTQELIVEKISRLSAFLKNSLNIETPKIALCALNPHAGESGLLGREEIDIMTPALEKLKA
ncbi:4-hydroxythreonine-4-phosphate dehydrogenase, partial [Candidatus Gastranaerophilus sp. (ex Termes propinquus)]